MYAEDKNKLISSVKGAAIQSFEGFYLWEEQCY